RHSAAASSIASDEVFSIAPTRDGRLLLGRTVAVGTGIEEFDLATRQFRRPGLSAQRSAPDRNKTIMSAFQVRSGDIVLPYNFGQIYRMGEPPMMRLLEPVAVDGSTIDSAPVLTFAEDEDGAVWVGTQRGLMRLDPLLRDYRRWTAGPHVFGEINSIVPLPAGRMWIGEVDGSFSLLDTRRRRIVRAFHPGEGRSLGAWSALLDRDDPAVIWFATQTAGL